MRTVPPALQGISFVCGETAFDEDNEEIATINLNAMNQKYKGKMPWHLSFSYGKGRQCGRQPSSRGLAKMPTGKRHRRR